MLKRSLWALLTVGSFLLSSLTWAETLHPVLYASPNLTPALQALITKLQDPAQKPLAYEELPAASGYYARIAPRKHILNPDNSLSEPAILGTKPFVFFTLPESLYGKSLLDMYLDIGYEAEDIIRWQRDADMVVVLFRYADTVGGAVQSLAGWDTVFALFDKLAAEATIEADKRGEFAPQTLFFTSAAQQQFVLGFPQAGKDRIKAASYASLAATGGADWAYRDLLEKKLSIFEHFRGNGRTLNELVDPRGVQHEAGLREFVGPNAKLKDLAEIAVLHLGALLIKDTMRRRSRRDKIHHKGTETLRYTKTDFTDLS